MKLIAPWPMIHYQTICNLMKHLKVIPLLAHARWERLSARKVNGSLYIAYNLLMPNNEYDNRWRTTDNHRNSKVVKSYITWSKFKNLY